MAGVYVHIPFCTKKCTYCNYLVSTETGLEDSYLRALLLEIRTRLSDEQWVGDKFDTIYFGGGTPSKFPTDSLEAILEYFRSQNVLAEELEITLECNPEDIRKENLIAWHEMGINRISLGLQSTDDSQLDWMKRAHTFEVGMEALMQIGESKISNYSADLIFGLPNQVSEDWVGALNLLLKSKPPHFSLYGLEALDNSGLKTQISRGEFEKIDEDLKSDMYLDGLDLMTSHGYASYELASFALEGRECQHNLKYWSHEDYLGFGVSAHSMRWDRNDLAGGIERRANTSSLKTYLSDPTSQDELVQLQGRDLANEYIMLRLRTSSGLDLIRLKKDYGYDLLSEKLELVLSFSKLGLIVSPSEHSFCLSREGRVQAEQITAALMA